MPYKDEEKRKSNSQKYYQEHREEIIAQKRNFYASNKEEINEKERENYKDPEHKKKKQEINKKSRIKNDDKIKKNQRTGKRRYQYLVSYSKRRELSCLLTEEQFTTIIILPCNYCNNQLGSTINATGSGLDRIDNSRGYELDNVVSCCVICNRMRGDHFTPEETKIAAQAVIAYRKNNLHGV